MKLNPWLREKLHRDPPEQELEFIVEVKTCTVSKVLPQLKRIGVKVLSTSFCKYILVKCTTDKLDEIQKIPEVEMIHYNAPVTISPIVIKDPLMGEVKVSHVEVPASFTEAMLERLLYAPFSIAPIKTKKQGVGYIIPTSESKKIIEAPMYPNNRVDLRVAILDTGLTPTHPQWVGRNVTLETTVPENGYDYMGHGMWCSCCVGGNPAQTEYGKVEGVALPTEILHVKCLTTIGSGATYGIMKAIELAYNWGAKVVSMSLGGELQGTVDTDPLCRLVKMLHKDMIFVVAGGNSGPDYWTIGTPGASPYALTVGALSIVDKDLAVYSSRGPNGKYYKDHQDDFEKDFEKYGEDLIKPDVVAPGGGRNSWQKMKNDDEVLYSGTTGWFDSYYDLKVNGYEGMHGTSQATPHVAGLVALLYKKGYRTAEQIKQKMKEIAEKEYGITEKDVGWGYGLIRYTFF